MIRLFRATLPALGLALLLTGPVVAATNDAALHHLQDRMRQDAQTAAPVPGLQNLPEPKLPTTDLHTEFVVETNAKGQVTRVRSGKSSPNATFNAQTYGNALQAFIRTESGQGVTGTFLLTYDYSAKTHAVRRDVRLVARGGDPHAVGAVEQMERMAAQHRSH